MKNAKLTDTKYLFISTTVACLENALIRGEKLDKLTEARDFDECFRQVCDIYSERGEVVFSADEYEKMLSAELWRAYGEITDLLISSGGETRLLEPLRVVYDCHNLKSCIKCEALGIPADDMLVSCGNYSREDICEMVRERDFSELSPILAEAAEKAIAQFSERADPQLVDVILDSGAFSEMADVCKKIGLPYLCELCDIRADMCNIMTFIRCARAMIDKSLLSEMLVDSGKLGKEFFLECFEGGKEKLFSELGGKYDSLADYAELPLSMIERKCDEIYLSCAESIWMSAFGPEKPIMYMIAKENEIRNVRIVLSGKKAKLAAETIRERLRVCSR